MTHIWVPRVKIIEPNDPVDMKTGMRGFYRMRAMRPDGRIRPLTDWFPNLITNAGLNLIGSSASWLTACQVGSGTTPPSVSDTVLANRIAGTSNRISSQSSAIGTPPYYATRTITYEFGQGAAAGNLTEVGVGNSTSGPTLFSRALILDGEGQPTTITVLPDEFLQVDYQLRIYPPLDDVQGQVTISGNTYNYTLRAAQAGLASIWGLGQSGARAGGDFCDAYESDTLGPITGLISGNSSSVFPSNSSYSPGTYYREFSAQWGLSQGNFATGIGGVSTYLGESSFNAPMGRVQMVFSPKVPKNNTKIFTLILRHTWAVRSL